MVAALIYIFILVTFVTLMTVRGFERNARNAAINLSVEAAKSVTTEDGIKTLEATFPDLKKYAYSNEEYDTAVKMLYDVANKSIKRAELQKQKAVYISNLTRKY